MTRHGRGVLGLGVAAWILAWLFGSRALFPVAAGLVLLVPVALGWVRLSRQRLDLSRRWDRRVALEGDDVRIALVVAPASRIPLPRAVARERIGGLGDREVELRRQRDGFYCGAYDLERVPRGRHVFEPVRVVVSDPWELASASLEVAEPETLLVYPRLVDLERLFSDDGSALNGGRRLLLRRDAGFTLHSVREHEPGDSLRRVHWPSTAHAGVLMVKELEDSPRDEIVVLLDGDAAGVAGAAPDSSFDAAVRAAGSILRARVRRGHRTALVLNTRGRETQSVAGDGPEWDRALGLLAGAVPDASTRAAALLDSGAGPAARSLELVVVTSMVEPALVSRLLERALSRRPVSLVHVDAATYAGRPSSPQPALLRLQAAGVPVAVVRRGEDLAAALEARAGAEAAHA